MTLFKIYKQIFLLLKNKQLMRRQTVNLRTKPIRSRKIKTLNEWHTPNQYWKSYEGRLSHQQKKKIKVKAIGKMRSFHTRRHICYDDLTSGNVYASIKVPFIIKPLNTKLSPYWIRTLTTDTLTKRLSVYWKYTIL